MVQQDGGGRKIEVADDYLSCACVLTQEYANLAITPGKKIFV